MRSAPSLGLVALLLAAGLGPASCSDDASPATTTGGAAGAAGKAGRAGSAGSAAKAGGAGTAGTAAPLPPLPSQDGFEIAEPVPVDYDCGPGCKKVFDVSYSQTSNFLTTVTRHGVVDDSLDRVYFSDGNEGSPTWMAGKFEVPPASYLSTPVLTAGLLTAIMSRIPVPAEVTQQAVLYVWDRVTGKVLHRHALPGYEQPPPPDPPYVPDYLGAGADDKYAVYTLGSRILRVTLETGEQKWIADGACFLAQLLDGKYLCADETTGQFRAVDVETGAVEVFAPSNAVQVEGSCSLQGDQCAWVDYRDPPGTGSSLYKRFGGDIYVFDRVARKLRRVTFDSPAAPKLKRQAAVEGNLVAWLEAGTVQTAPSDPYYLRQMDRVVKLDLDKGTRCWFDRKFVGFNLVYKRRYWGPVGDPDHQGGARAASLDLDSAEIPWTCEPSPPPVVINK